MRISGRCTRRSIDWHPANRNRGNVTEYHEVNPIDPIRRSTENINTMGEARWLYNRVFDGESVNFHDLAKHMNGFCGIDRELRSPGSFARWPLQRRVPKIFPQCLDDFFSLDALGYGKS